MNTKHIRGLERQNDVTLNLENSHGLDIQIFANESVPIEAAAVEELSSLVDLQATALQFKDADAEAFAEEPRIEKISLTPDFHKANGIPVGTVLETSGFVVPQAIGNDINCGMRLHTTFLLGDRIRGHLDELETECRKIYFEAGRRIPTTHSHREGLLLNGIEGLFDTVEKDFDEGLWSYFHRCDKDETLRRIDRRGSLAANRIHQLRDFVGQPGKLHRDSQIGSIGGGNHFVEIQEIKRIIDGSVAHAWGLKEGMATVMVHTGSVGIGHSAGSFYRDKVREIYPKTIRHPQNGIFLLPLAERFEETANLFWDAMHNGRQLCLCQSNVSGIDGLVIPREHFWVE